MASEMIIHTNATLRLLGEDLEPENVSAALRMPADRSYRKGDLVPARKQAFRTKGYWSATSSKHVKGTADFNEHVSWLVGVIRPRRRRLLSYRKHGWQVDICIGVHTSAGHGGPVVHPDTLRALGGLGLDVCFDLYPDA
jgi:hypothetical protein